MPTEIDEDLRDRLIDILDLISGAREPAHRFEREIRLFQFQTWIYFPDQAPEMQRLAGLLAAAKFLEHLERKDRKIMKSQRGKAATYARLFSDPTYSKLFDATIGKSFKEGANGFGWLRLLRQPTLRQFDQETLKRIEQSDPVWKMIEYQFRHLDHQPTNPKLANIARAQVYVWKDRDQAFAKKVLEKPLPGKTIRDRWSKMRASAIFLYVDQAFDFRFHPRNLAEKAL